MTTVLLIIIYIAFISLGLPDSLFGAAWPAIYSEFQLPISYGSFVTVISACGTIVSSMFSARLINRFGTSKVTAFSTALTAMALFGFSCSGNYWLLCLFSVPLGLGAGTIDTALNNYVALHYSATQMSFLHCFYGIGVSISPYVLSLVINSEAGWRGGYQVAFCVQAIIALMLFATLGVWNKVKSQKEEGDEEEVVAKTLTFKEVMSIPGVKLMSCMFFTACAIEFICGSWGSTFLVEYKHMAADKAAQIVTFYYVGMTLGRFLSGVLATKLNGWQLINLSQVIIGVAVVALLLPGSAYVSAVGLFLIGVGIGPLFPNFTYLTPQSFGADVSQSVLGKEMAFAYVGIMVAPPICGVLGQMISMGVFPIYILVLFAVMIAATWKLKRVLEVK